MLDHVFQFGVQKGEELFTTGTPSVQMTSLQKGSDVGDTPDSPPHHIVNIPLVTIHSKFYGQVINRQN